MTCHVLSKNEFASALKLVRETISFCNFVIFMFKKTRKHTRIIGNGKIHIHICLQELLKSFVMDLK